MQWTKKFPTTVTAYIAAAAPAAKPMLRQLRTIVKAVAPKASERMSYGMPAYNLFDRPLVYFAAFKDHCSLFPAGNAAIKKFAKALGRYKTSKGTIQFPLDKPLPVTLVKKIVQARVRQNTRTKK